MSVKKKKIRISVVLQRIITYAATLVFLFPFYICVITSIKSRKDMTGIFTLPDHIEWNNFTEAIEKAKLVSSMQNSIYVTVLTVLLTLVVSAMAGYGIARGYKMKPFRMYETVLLAAQMVPFQTIMIPLYKMFKSMGLLNTHAGAILLIAAGNMPFAVMLFVGFIRTLPYELEEAAYLEGCGKYRTFIKIIVPLLKPIIATIAILDALWTWNEFNISLLVLQKNALKTIPLQQYVFFGQHSANYNMAFAAALISMIPIIIFFTVGQKRIVAGMTVGAVKG